MMRFNDLKKFQTNFAVENKCFHLNMGGGEISQCSWQF